jgi:hypothetical protein
MFRAGLHENGAAATPYLTDRAQGALFRAGAPLSRGGHSDTLRTQQNARMIEEEAGGLPLPPRRRRRGQREVVAG